MPEWKVLVLLALGPTLWMAGGYKWRWWRRAAWPLVAVGVLWGAAPWWRVGVSAIALYGTTTLPYGERTPWWLRCLVFSSYALPGAVFSLPTALICAGVGAILLSMVMWASHRFNRVTWKIWEALAGLFQAATLLICLGA